MNRFGYDSDTRITPSVLDRLIDRDPKAPREAPTSRLQSLNDLKDAVKRDLEWLLNARQVVGGVPPELKELSRSLAVYGLPDFTAVSVKSPADQMRMQRALEMAISAFEPRLENITVSMSQSRELDHKLRFRIDAQIKVEPAPEPVTFDTVLQATTNQYVVKAE
jgi:type VI secretion system protein ImpF